MKYHLALKFLALILCAAAILMVVGGTVGVVSFVNLGIYSNTLEELQDKQRSDDLGALAERTAMYYATRQTECTEAFLEAYFAAYDYEHDIRAPQEGTWYYEIVDYNSKETLFITPGAQETAGAILYKEFLIAPEYPRVVGILDGSQDLELDRQQPQKPEDPDAPEAPETVYPAGSFEFEFENKDNFTTETYVLVMEDAPIYKVKLYLLPGAYEQKVAFIWELLALAHENRYLPLVVLGAGLLLLAVLLTYLAAAAGKKTGEEKLRPAALNRLPLDVYLALSVAVVWLLADGYVLTYKRWFDSDTSTVIIWGTVITAYLACLLLSGFYFAAAAQLRLHGHIWWRRSLIRNLFLLLRRWGRSLRRLAGVCHSSLKKTWRRFLDTLPLTWQWVLWVGVMCLSLVAALLSGEFWAIAAALVFVAASCFYAMHAFKVLYDGAKRMSQGDLKTPVDTEALMGGFADFATQLNALADVAVVAAQKQMRSERMRAELITNVSHDIKTPLTSIINYVDLLQSAQSQEDAAQYLEVLSRQSLRMKKLIDDLIELSKATTGNMPVDIQSADAVEYLNQAIGEFADKLEAVPLMPVFEPPQEPAYIRCDSRLTWRVLSNLLSNAVKYALPGTRLYADVTVLQDTVLISLKNISRQQLNVSSDELMERFVRGDTARNTEGSGLGLNIAKSLMELQRGQLKLLIDGDLFKATMVFPRDKEHS